MYYIIVENNNDEKANFTLNVTQDLSQVINDGVDAKAGDAFEDKFDITETVEAVENNKRPLFVVLFVVLTIVIAIIIARFSRSGNGNRSLLSRFRDHLVAWRRRKLLFNQSNDRN